MRSVAFGESLVIEEHLSIQCETQESSPDLARLERQNRQVLTLLSALDELPPSDGGDDHSEYAVELFQINAKLSVLLSLVGELMSKDWSDMASTRVMFNDQAVSWETSANFAVGLKVMVSLFFEHCPKPLKFMGDVIEQEVTENGQRLVVMFTGVHEALRDELTKFIFRRHRRAVATAKTESP